MNGFMKIVLGSTLLLVGLSGGASAQGKKMYRWVDDQGVVHFGDHVPPEFADTNRQVLNQQGVAVGAESGAKTPG